MLSHRESPLYSFIQSALSEAGLPAECLTGITDPDRTLLQTLLTQTRFIDVVIPRGGDALIEFVSKHSHIP